jgi:hypothetical protein
VGSADDEHEFPQALQLLGSVWRFVHIVGVAAGQALVTEPVLGAQVPLGIPVVALEQPMQPEAARAHAVPQQTLSTHALLAQSVPRLHETPRPFLGRQLVPEQKYPAAQPVVAPLHVVPQAVADAQVKPLQVPCVPATHVREVLQAPAEVNVTLPCPSAVHDDGLQAVAQPPQCCGVLSGVSQPAAVVQSPNPGMHVCTHVPVEQSAVALGALVQATPQPPQLVAVLVLVSQPRSPLPEQCANPTVHDVEGIEHTPAPQLTGAPVLTFVAMAQLWVQVPQLALSV